MLENLTYQLAFGFSVVLLGQLFVLWGVVSIRFCRQFINLNLRFMKYFGYGKDLQRLAGDVVLARFIGAVAIVMGLVTSGIGINLIGQDVRKNSRSKVVASESVGNKETR